MRFFKRIVLVVSMIFLMISSVSAEYNIESDSNKVTKSKIISKFSNSNYTLLEKNVDGYTVLELIDNKDQSSDYIRLFKANNSITVYIYENIDLLDFNNYSYKIVNNGNSIISYDAKGNPDILYAEEAINSSSNKYSNKINIENIGLRVTYPTPWLATTWEYGDIYTDGQSTIYIIGLLLGFGNPVYSVAFSIASKIVQDMLPKAYFKRRWWSRFLTDTEWQRYYNYYWYSDAGRTTLIDDYDSAIETIYIW